MEKRESEEILYKLSPRFNFIYELIMPTGRKIKSTISILFVLCIATIFFLNNTEKIDVGDIVLFADMSILKFLLMICIIIDVFFILKLIFHIVFQILQYKHITYTFYNNHMVYEDDFLNQHKKNIEYSNIKEVEIRRTIMDRILGYGVIIIYTNAENIRNNGLVIYAIKDPKKSYDIIENIIQKSKVLKTESKIESKQEELVKNIQENIEISSDTNIVTEDNISDEEYSSEAERKKRIEENKKEEEDFINSLKNINNESENL